MHQHALMEETARTATAINYSWKWSVQDVPCGVYVGVVNFQIGGKPVTGSIVKDRLRVFFRRENGQLVKSHETVPWD